MASSPLLGLLLVFGTVLVWVDAQTGAKKHVEQTGAKSMLLLFFSSSVVPTIVHSSCSTKCKSENYARDGACDAASGCNTAGCEYDFGDCQIGGNCGAGRYKTMYDDDCKLCPLGQYQSNKSHTFSSCISCEAGMYQPKKSSSSCISCEKGKYQTTTGKTSCADCRSGQTTDGTGQVALVDSKGYTRPQSAFCRSSTCSSLCKRETDRDCDYSSGCNNAACGYDNGDCTVGGNCGPGTYRMQPWASVERYNCHRCGSGKYQSASKHSSSVCIDCPAGKYGDYSMDDRKSCISCPAGKMPRKCACDCKSSIGLYPSQSDCERGQCIAPDFRQQVIGCSSNQPPNEECEGGSPEPAPEPSTASADTKVTASAGASSAPSTMFLAIATLVTVANCFAA